MIRAKNLRIRSMFRGSLASAVAATLSVAGLLMTPALGAAARAGDDGKVMVSASKQASSGSRETIYKVTPGAQLIIKQVCVDHPAVYVEVGRSRDRVSFHGSGCTSFDPGYLVAGGNDIRCLNRSGQRHSCSIMGVLHQRAEVRAGAKFYDVEQELAKAADGKAGAEGSE